MALEGGPSERQHVLEAGRDGGLPKVCCRRTSLHSGHVGSAAGSSRWAYALRSGGLLHWGNT